ncbi:metallophosphoesterase family protein [Haloferula rosea]|uniref:Metallophosphoesterase n=1 Tax=Haloferula rosea TaxID=490093 RepID=A0A934REV6_9BACT|nr:metallophosphoesterase [Haloferula rosea]MBK1828252.1 metallophosphoesterase [Haloferula rosea]
MKLLLVADLHYTLRQWDWVLSMGERFDMVIIAGDLLDIASIVPLEAQIVVIRKYLERIAAKAPLLVASGNHDVLEDPRLSEKTAAWLLDDLPASAFSDGDGVARDDLFFSVLPWWDGPEVRQQIENQLAEQAELARGKRWIWVHHPPPMDTAVAWDGHRDRGDEILREWIQTYHPWLVLGGHIHNAPFVSRGSWIDLLGSTWIFNGGRQIGGVPTFTLIDTEKQEASWVSMENAEKACLEEPLQRHPLVP